VKAAKAEYAKLGKPCVALARLMIVK